VSPLSCPQIWQKLGRSETPSTHTMENRDIWVGAFFFWNKLCSLQISSKGWSILSWVLFCRWEVKITGRSEMRRAFIVHSSF